MRQHCRPVEVVQARHHERVRPRPGIGPGKDPGGESVRGTNDGLRGPATAGSRRRRTSFQSSDAAVQARTQQGSSRILADSTLTWWARPDSLSYGYQKTG